MTTPQAPARPESFLGGLIRDWALAIVVVLGLLAGYNWLFGTGAPGPGPAPQFSLNDLDGETVALSSLEGTVILNFWFTSCAPCRAEIPELSKFHAEHPEIPLFGVSTDIGMPTGTLRALSNKLGVRYPVLHDARGKVADLYGISAFPTTVIVRDGQIVRGRTGIVDRQWLEGAIAAP